MAGFEAVYRFGVCYCEDIQNSNIEDLIEFETYEDARKHYLTVVLDLDSIRSIDRNTWIVWIREDGTIEQFEKLEWKVISKLVKVTK